jgi:hypothetical protein
MTQPDQVLTGEASEKLLIVSAIIRLAALLMIFFQRKRLAPHLEVMAVESEIPVLKR